MNLKFHRDGSLPTDDSIFVFGSNIAGIHGAGAARVAREKFGAKLLMGRGITGHSYAIPTKDADLECLGLTDIEKYVNQFVACTRQNPHLSFFVTRVGCGLAGNRDCDIAPMFRGAINCSFPQQWEEYLIEQRDVGEWVEETVKKNALDDLFSK